MGRPARRACPQSERLSTPRIGCCTSCSRSRSLTSPQMCRQPLRSRARVWRRCGAKQASGRSVWWTKTGTSTRACNSICARPAFLPLNLSAWGFVCVRRDAQRRAITRSRPPKLPTGRPYRRSCRLASSPEPRRRQPRAQQLTAPHFGISVDRQLHCTPHVHSQSTPLGHHDLRGASVVGLAVGSGGLCLPGKRIQGAGADDADGAGRALRRFGRLADG